MLRSSTETYPLTTIDLANLCAKPVGERYRYLRQWQKPSVWRSYGPTRKHLPKLIAREPTLALDLVRDDKEALLRSVANSCRYGDGDVEANLAVSEAIWDWALEMNAKSLVHDFSPYRSSLGTNYFFESGIVLLGDRGYGIFLDPRRSTSCLTVGGQNFVFSAMYWQTSGIADYIDLELGLLKISDSKSKRKAKLIELNGPPVFSKGEVEERIEVTQKIWLDVQLERRAESARGADSR